MTGGLRPVEVDESRDVPVFPEVAIQWLKAMVSDATLRLRDKLVDADP